MNSSADDSVEFPVLSDDELATLRRYGTVRQTTAGQVLISPADDVYDLTFVLSGGVEVADASRGRSVLFAQLGHGQFAGELSLLTGQRPSGTARVTAGGEIIVVAPGQLRKLLAREAELAEVLMAAFIARRRRRVSQGASSAVVEVIGTGRSARALALRSFLSRNTIAYRWVDLDRVDSADDVLDDIGASRDDLPIAITPTQVLMHAGSAELAEALRVGRRPERYRLFDAIVVGGGPAGLAAAVYGASEGLEVAVLEAAAPGGQAGATSRIENYLGFPEGISGTELTTRATIQAQKFGALLASPCRVERLTAAGEQFSVLLTDGTALSARTVVAATGALYRRLPLAGWQRLEGAGIYYAATDLEAGLCAGSPVVVLGGGNSAGQAALYLARHCPRVTIVIRGDSFAASMSQYLIDRVAANPRIDTVTSTIIQAVDGGEHLESVTLRDTATGNTTRLAAGGLFCFIGAQPESSWLPEDVARDDDGFVLTDIAVPPGTRRPRLPYETSVDGVFAAGDIREGSMKRVAAAVGDGSSVVRSIHRYLSFCSDRLPATIHQLGKLQRAPSSDPKVMRY
jgi:thioredoxin reductase (NADPH)